MDDNKFDNPSEYHQSDNLFINVNKSDNPSDCQQFSPLMDANKFTKLF